MRRDDIRRLHEQRATCHSAMLKLSEAAEKEERDFTAEEQQEYDRQVEDFQTLETRANRAEAEFERELAVQKSLTNPIEKRIGADDDDVPSSYKEYQEQRSGTRTSETPEFRSAMWRYLSVNALPDLDVEEQRALSKGTNSAGGYTVPVKFEQELMTILRWQGSVASLAREMVTDAGETIQLPNVSAHGTGAWLAEAATYTPSDETFTQPSLSAYKASSKVIVSEELIQDSGFDLQAYLAEELGARLGVLENTAFIKGDGSGKPTGLLTSSAGTASNLTTDTTAPTGSSTTFTYTDLVNGMFALPHQYRRNASFIVADGAVKNLYLMIDSQNRPLWNVNVAGTGPDTFLGKSIYADPDMPAPAAGKVSILFGDWNRAYRIRRVRGIGLQRQSELHSDQGQIGFRAFERVDGKVVQADAGVGLKHSAT